MKSKIYQYKQAKIKVMRKTRIKILALAVVFCGLSMQSFSGNNEDLVAACKKGDLAEAQKAIEAGADVNFIGADGWNPIGASFFWPEITKLLLDKNADPNGGNAMAMSNAAGTGSAEVIKLLLAACADPNKPLVIDVIPGYQKAIEAAKLRLSHTAAEENQTKDMKKAYDKVDKMSIKSYEAAIEKAKTEPGTQIFPITRVVQSTLCKECLEALIEKGAKTDIKNPATDGNLLDDFAGYSLAPANWIENNKAQVDGWEKSGFTVPDWYKNQDIKKLSSPDEMIKVLVKAGVDINAERKQGFTPLLSAISKLTSLNNPNLKPEVAIALINNGAKVDVETFMGHALVQAAALGHIDLLEAMFAKGLDMNREFKINDLAVGQTLKGINPLMWAARNGKLEAVKYLVEKGAKLDEGAYGNSFNIKTKCVTTVKNKTAMFYAIEGENLDVVKFLAENTKADWSEKIKINQMKQTNINEGFYTTTTTISCLDDGSYSPSKYAKESGLVAISDYLKSKKL
jgi:ankyrin repeat protein